MNIYMRVFFFLHRMDEEFKFILEISNCFNIALPTKSEVLPKKQVIYVACQQVLNNTDMSVNKSNYLVTDHFAPNKERMYNVQYLSPSQRIQ